MDQIPITKGFSLSNRLTETLYNAPIALFTVYIKAEDDMVTSFAVKEGITLPEKSVTDVKLRQSMMSKIEVITSTRGAGLPLEGGETIVQESWCVDRRDGKQGFEKTYPCVQLIVEGTTFTVRTVYEG